MTANQAIEIINNAQNYSMVEIREAEQVIESMVEKAGAFDELVKHLKYKEMISRENGFHGYADIYTNILKLAGLESDALEDD